MNYEYIAKSIIKSLKNIYKELSIIISKFDINYIYKQSLPLQPTDKCNKEQSKEIVKLLEKTYYPYFDALLPMIEDGVLEYKFDDSIKNENILQETIYDSWDNLYNMQFIKYNLTLSCIMQIYLFLEQSLIKQLHKYMGFNKNNLFDAIKFMKPYFTFDEDILKKLNMYRDVINVYKHGFGDSYENIKNNNSSILNKYNNVSDKNYDFMFNLKKISLKELYDVSISFLNTLKGK